MDGIGSGSNRQVSSSRDNNRNAGTELPQATINGEAGEAEESAIETQTNRPK